jgi:hypothetical protein
VGRKVSYVYNEEAKNEFFEQVSERSEASEP